MIFTELHLMIAYIYTFKSPDGGSAYGWAWVPPKTVLNALKRQETSVLRDFYRIAWTIAYTPPSHRMAIWRVDDHKYRQKWCQTTYKVLKRRSNMIFAELHGDNQIYRQASGCRFSNLMGMSTIKTVQNVLNGPETTIFHDFRRITQ